MDKKKSLKPLKLYKEVQRLSNQSNDKKIVEFKKYYTKCQEIEKQVECFLIALIKIHGSLPKRTAVYNINLRIRLQFALQLLPR